MFIRVIVIALWFALLAQPAIALDVSETISKLIAESNNERFRQTTVDYQSLPESLKLNAEICYVIAFSYMRLHDYKSAQPLLLKALEHNFDGYPGWDRATKFLDRIKTMEQLCPPLYKEYRDGDAMCTVYGPNSIELRSVYDEIPNFLQRAKLIFGDNIPPIRFYLFDQREAYNRFYTAMFDYTSQRSWQNGTGNYNVVAYCIRDKDGKLEPNMRWAIACILHEYGHSLCGTIFGDLYYSKVPDWLNEGLADAVAMPYFKNLYERSPEIIKKGFTSTAPSYSEMSRDLYKYSPVGYPLARLMVLRLVKNDPTVISRILTKAKNNNCNFDSAVFEVTGRKPSVLYQEILNEYWHQ